MDAADRETWRAETLASRTLAGVATMIYSLVASASGVLPILQDQDMQEKALIRQVYILRKTTMFSLCFCCVCMFFLVEVVTRTRLL